MIADRYRPAFLAGAALVLCMAALGLFWPGVALYDTVAQYRQVVSGQFDDWHPPIMARLWRVMHAAFGGAAAPDPDGSLGSPATTIRLPADVGDAVEVLVSALMGLATQGSGRTS